MRSSNRTKILDAAIRVVSREGITALTYESISVEAGLTHGGMLYHFPSREALLLGLHEYVSQQWESALEAAAGKTAEEATAQERFAAYVKVATQMSATRVELQFKLEGSTSPELAAPWTGVISRWAPGFVGETPDHDAMHWIVRLAADGLWAYESITNQTIPAELRERISTQLLSMLPGASVADKDEKGSV